MTKDEALKLALEALGHFEKAGLATLKTIDAIIAIREALAQPDVDRRSTESKETFDQQEPVAFGFVTVRRLSQRFENHHDQYQFYPAGQSPYLDNVDECHTVYTTPPQRKPLIREEVEAFKKWFDAWWLGDQENGQVVPTQGHELFANYISEYTLAFGAWMAAKETAHGIKE